MKYTGPKARRVRRFGVNLYGSDKYDRILQKKPYGPGKNSKTRSARPSEFSRQLTEKQKARDIYGLSEKQFHNLYAEAAASMGQTGDTMKTLLESRLDNAVFRAGYAMTRLQSRQFTSHGVFFVDGVRVTTPSFRVKPGNVITIRPRTKDSAVFGPILEKHEKYMPPHWLKVDTKAGRIEVVALPMPADAEQAVDMRQVVEFYSRN